MPIYCNENQASLIDKPKELLELINECLKPKEIEKNKFGEVFTQMNLVKKNIKFIFAGTNGITSPGGKAIPH